VHEHFNAVGEASTARLPRVRAYLHDGGVDGRLTALPPVAVGELGDAALADVGDTAADDLDEISPAGRARSRARTALLALIGVPAVAGITSTALLIARDDGTAGVPSTSVAPSAPVRATPTLTSAAPSPQSSEPAPPAPAAPTPAEPSPAEPTASSTGPAPVVTGTPPPAAPAPPSGPRLGVTRAPMSVAPEPPAADDGPDKHKRGGGLHL
jgi:hypothetical protein